MGSAAVWGSDRFWAATIAQRARALILTRTNLEGSRSHGVYFTLHYVILSVHCFGPEIPVESRYEVHSQQKAAWFVLIVIAGTLVLYVAAVPALSWWFHRTMAEAAGPALGVFGLVGLTGLESLFYRARRDAARGNDSVAAMDERDWLLSKQAWTAGMRVFWLAFCIAGVAAWAYLYYIRGLERVNVPVSIFPVMVFAGFVLLMLVRSLATLHYYGWKASDAGR